MAFDYYKEAGFLILTLWSLFWKGLALWRSSQNKQKTWFIVILILNTVGILEIIYLFIFQKENKLNIQDFLNKFRKRGAKK